jgi:NAD(P)H-hydrate epimerase
MGNTAAHTYIATAAQTRRLEVAAVERGATWPGLMEQAGCGIADLIAERYGPMRGKHVLALVGPGNNGGDGLVIARHGHDAGAHVTLYVWQRQARSDDEPWQACRTRSLLHLHAADDPDQQILRQLAAGSHVIVDALLGIGVTRPLDGTLRAIVDAVNAVRAARTDRLPVVVAVDLPTGVDADTGTIMGTAIQADLTAATGVLKHGHVREPGRAAAGDVVCVSLNLPLEE